MSFYSYKNRQIFDITHKYFIKISEILSKPDIRAKNCNSYTSQLLKNYQRKYIAAYAG